MIDLLRSWLETIQPFAIKIVGALLILFAGFIAGRLIGLFVIQMLKGVMLDKNLKKILGFKFSLERFIGGVVSFIVYVVTIILALNYLGLTTIILIILVSIVLIIFLLSFLLAIRDLLPNAFAGFTLKYRSDVVKGKTVMIKNVVGKVVDVRLLSTKINSDGDILVIPNSCFQKEEYSILNNKKFNSNKNMSFNKKN